jgi:DNA-binding PadR family transcriptional regulator
MRLHSLLRHAFAHHGCHPRHAHSTASHYDMGHTHGPGWHLSGRGHGGHGEGWDRHGGGGFGGDDGEGWRRGRKFSSEDLQLMLLGLLEEQPSHGYELIKALEARTNGFYKPSPGMVYPALTYLEEVGHASVDSEGNKKRYRLAEPGQRYLDENRERLDLILNKLKHAARKMAWLRRAMSGEAPEDEAGGWIPEFVEARVALKRALVARVDAPVTEQRRIAAILAQATAQIEAGPGSTSA